MTLQQSEGKNSTNQLQQQQQEQLQTKMNENTAEFTGGKVNFSFDFQLDAKADAVFRQPRSQAFMDAVAAIDLLSSTDEEIIEKLRGTVDEDTLEEFSEMSKEELLEEIMLSFREEMDERAQQLSEMNIEPENLKAIISQCFISGCDIHAIDEHGYIMEHYSEGQKLSDGLEKARQLFHENKQNCNCIEVYQNCCRLIRRDGSVETYQN